MNSAKEIGPWSSIASRIRAGTEGSSVTSGEGRREFPLVEPRPAATVIVARPSEGGPEVLMLQRGPGVRFGPGFVVFPGGTIDPEDGELGERWFGSSAEDARAAAIRELAEETQIVVTALGVRKLHP